MRTRRTWGGASRTDALVALAFAVGAPTATAIAGMGRRLDAPGALLLVAAALCLTWCRVRPGAVVIGVIVFTMPYHRMEYLHEPAAVIMLVALAFYAAYSSWTRTVVVGVTMLAFVVVAMALQDDDRSAGPPDRVGMAGWVIAAMGAGRAWRNQQAYVNAIIDRADRAERTRDEVARRRVVEERLRIARDLHDLLAHSITLIGVQAGVAAHLAAQDPPAERPQLAAALETIAETCREAGHEIRATLAVLREADDGTGYEAVPGLSGLAGLLPLADAVRSAGIEVELRGHDGPALAPELGVAVHRIVQEALTNVVKHAGARHVRVDVDRDEDADTLRVRVRDDGRGASDASPSWPDGAPGFGIPGMTERARSVGGALTAERGPDGGFTVTAVLPNPTRGRTP